MDEYNQFIAKNPRVEMIHVSQDSNKTAAASWAGRSKFPWPTVLPEDVARSGLNKFRNGNFVPDYSLVRADGTKMGSGRGIFEQAKRL